MLRSVLFVDPPAFCTTVEGMVAPALRERPIAVAPPGAARATVLALSGEAKAAGITRGMPVDRARKLCRDLILLPPNPTLYARASRALHEILRRYAPIIEPKGYGHAFLDLTGTGRLFGPSQDVGARIQRETADRIGLPLSVGAATNKLVSQAAVGVGRGGGAEGQRGRVTPLLHVPGGSEREFLAPQPVALLPETPEEIRERLDEYQLDLIGQIAAIEERQLCAVFGSAGRILAQRARGIDPRPVLPPERKAEFRAVHTLATDTNDLGILHPLLRRLTERLGRRLRERRLVARRLTLEFAYTDYDRARRSLPLQSALLDVELWDAARRAFTLANQRTVAIRAVSITVDRLVEADMQLELWTSPPVPLSLTGEGERWGERPRGAGEEAVLQQAIDRIHVRWGTRGIRRQ